MILGLKRRLQLCGQGEAATGSSTYFDIAMIRAGKEKKSDDPINIPVLCLEAVNLLNEVFMKKTKIHLDTQKNRQRLIA